MSIVNCPGAGQEDEGSVAVLAAPSCRDFRYAIFKWVRRAAPPAASHAPNAAHLRPVRKRILIGHPSKFWLGRPESSEQQPFWLRSILSCLVAVPCNARSNGAFYPAPRKACRTSFATGTEADAREVAANGVLSVLPANVHPESLLGAMTSVLVQMIPAARFLHEIVSASVGKMFEPPGVRQVGRRIAKKMGPLVSFFVRTRLAAQPIWDAVWGARASLKKAIHSRLCDDLGWCSLCAESPVFRRGSVSIL